MYEPQITEIIFESMLMADVDVKMCWWHILVDNITKI